MCITSGVEQPDILYYVITVLFTTLLHNPSHNSTKISAFVTCLMCRSEARPPQQLMLLSVDSSHVQ